MTSSWCGEVRAEITLISLPQDDGIERILKSRGEWNPPWKQERRARGPPNELELVPDESEFAP